MKLFKAFLRRLKIRMNPSTTPTLITLMRELSEAVAQFVEEDKRRWEKFERKNARMLNDFDKAFTTVGEHEVAQQVLEENELQEIPLNQ